MCRKIGVGEASKRKVTLLPSREPPCPGESDHRRVVGAEFELGNETTDTAFLAFELKTLTQSHVGGDASDEGEIAPFLLLELAYDL